MRRRSRGSRSPPMFDVLKAHERDAMKKTTLFA